MPEYLALPSSSFSKDRTLICRIECAYLIPGPSAVDGTEPYDILDSWLPAARPLGLVALDRKATKQDDGDWILVIGFEGAKDGAPLGYFIELDYASVDSPLETLETWEDFQKKWKGVVEEYKLKGFKPTIRDPVSGEMVKNPLLGQTHFLESNPVLRVTFGLRDFKPGLFENCSKIQKPMVPTAFTDLLNVPDGMSWLKRTVKGSYRGNVWQFALEYHLGKWIPDIYEAKKDDGLNDLAGRFANVA